MSLAPSRRALAIADPRVVLLPLELIDPRGILPDGRRLLREDAGLAEDDVDLLGEGLRRHRERARLLSRRAVEIAPPTTRSVAIVLDPREIRPFASLLNDSAWVLCRSDVEASTSSPELVAWLLAVADRLRTTPDVTLAPPLTRVGETLPPLRTPQAVRVGSVHLGVAHGRPSPGSRTASRRRRRTVGASS